MEKLKNNKGITLITLTLTIIILTIIATITIGVLNGENGALENATIAREENRGSQVEEERDIWNVNKSVKKKPESLNSLLNRLQNDKLITAEEKEEILNTGEVTDLT